MKRIFILAAILVFSAFTVPKASAQYNGHDYRNIRREKEDIYNDRQRLAELNRAKQADLYYGDRRAYRIDKHQERRIVRDIRHDRRRLRRDAFYYH
jgi:hypothetical protein